MERLHGYGYRVRMNAPVTNAVTGTTSAEFYRPSKALAALAGRAIIEFDMIRPGDRVLLGLSGGKDSLSLLHILNYFRQRAPVRFELGAMTVDPMAGDFDPSPMIPYLAALGVDYHYVRRPIMELAKEHMGRPSYCAFCSRLKRGLMYQTAREQGYNVIALAQHLDDLAESFLLSAFHGGQLRTMKAHYVNDDGDLRIIRPLVFVRERMTRDFAQCHALPVIADSCPACFAMPTQRQHMKELLAGEEAHNRQLFKSLLTTLKPLMRDGMPERVTP
jgi:tRNA 2-thiocytidine biosynthesis protein TtcA